LVERGDFLPQERENWDPTEVYQNLRYRAPEEWLDGDGKAFRPGLHYYVGGSSKVWGACLVRMRECDFEEVRHIGGSSPAWPFSYEALAPYYDRAEQLYGVHGAPGGGADPTAPPLQAPPPYPAVPNDPTLERLQRSFRRQGLHPFPLPVGIDPEGDGPGRCVRCDTCDGYPCRTLGKNDADVRCVRPAMRRGVRLAVRTRIDRLVTDQAGGRVIAAVGERDGVGIEICASKFVLACGAANSAALLLRSANAAHPAGLANSSGLVGRNYMQHQFTAIMAVNPLRRSRIKFQKTIAVNDFYRPAAERPFPLGNIQPLGKLHPGMYAAKRSWVPMPVLRFMSERSTDWLTTTEDLPEQSNCVTLSTDGRIQLTYCQNNVAAQLELTRKAVRMLRRAGFPFVFTYRMGIDATAAQCGTARAGTDPRTSVLDPLCRTHDVPNLYVVDGSFFPSSSGLNPGLTIAAQAVRVAAESDLVNPKHGA
jgi:choline dehydrogenase-like flavoprotein